MLVGHIVDIKEVSVVEEIVGAWVGDDTLAEIVGDLAAQIATHVKIEVTAIDTTFFRCAVNGAIIVHFRTGFEPQCGYSIICFVLSSHSCSHKQR